LQENFDRFNNALYKEKEMADFRRSIIVLAALALLIGTVTTASAAPNTPLSCIASGANPTQLRAEGLTEKTGDVLINCTGGVPTDAAPNVVPTSNIQIFLNTSLTSRILNSTTQASEALLLINEPAPATQKVCVVGNTNCNMYGQGALPFSTNDPYNTGTLSVAGGQAYNVFQGQQVTTGSVTFNGIPIDAPGTQGTLFLRVVNIRGNANGLGVTSVNAPPVSVTATISTSGTATLTITNNAQQVVGQVQKGLVITNSSALTFQQCTDTLAAAGTITFAKGFAASFKIQNVVGPENGTAPGVPLAQDVPGTIYSFGPGGQAGVEYGFYNPAFPAGATSAGVADYGTRLRIIFAGVQAGVTLYVPLTAAYDDTGTTPTTDINLATPVLSTVGAVPELFVRLVTSEGGPFTAASAGSGTGAVTGFAALTVGSTGTAEAVYEVLAVRGQILQENVAIPFWIAYTANPGADSPGLGTATVGGSFAPVSTDTNASATDTIPRFADTSVAVNAFSIVKCATHLLFPFVTNQAGFDTGMAIANTSMDQYGTSTQTGTCTFNFFGTAAPAAVTTAAAVDPGTVYTNLTSVLAPGFQGYVIVDCQFQYAHGFAFITQIGTFLGTEGYLALIIPDPPNPRLPNFPAPGPSGEQLSN
jgi:hypothetical protein